MYHVRFNLDRRSDRFKQWQVKEVSKCGGVTFHVDPTRHSIVMRHCRLVNKPRIAARVFESQVRDVCGYIECDTFDLVNPVAVDDKVMVVFDPKIVPYWRFEYETDSIDNRKFKELVTQGRRVYAPMREVALYY